jgi:ATP synthase protein I
MTNRPPSEENHEENGGDRVARAARRAARRDETGRAEPEPSLGARLGQIGILGWTIVLPTLLCLALGRWLDRIAGTRVFFSAPLVMIGAAIGLWSAWRWMHRQQRRDHD